MFWLLGYGQAIQVNLTQEYDTFPERNRHILHSTIWWLPWLPVPILWAPGVYEKNNQNSQLELKLAYECGAHVGCKVHRPDFCEAYMLPVRSRVVVDVPDVLGQLTNWSELQTNWILLLLPCLFKHTVVFCTYRGKLFGVLIECVELANVVTNSKTGVILDWTLSPSSASAVKEVHIGSQIEYDWIPNLSSRAFEICSLVGHSMQADLALCKS